MRWREGASIDDPHAGLLSSPPMKDDQVRMLDTFPEFLRSLPVDTKELAALLADAELPEPVRLTVAGSLNYLFKSLDLIPDGIEDLGFLDDAFVLRVAARQAKAELAGAAPEVIARLADQASLVEALLADAYPRLDRFVAALATSAARGRTTEEIVRDPAIRAAFQQDLGSFAASYGPPVFTRDEKNLVKLTAFLNDKLPA